MTDRPDVNTQVRHLTPGWRLWRQGRWHRLTKTQPSPSGLILRTDEQTGGNQFGPIYRTFIASPDLLVAASPPAD